MKILVVKLSSLGDLFHALPAVHNLKVELQAGVDWVVQSEYAELVRCFRDVGRVIPFQRRAVLRSLRPFLGELRRERYDLVVDFQGLLKSALVARLARAGRRIGPSFHREGSRLFYTEVTGARNKARHAVEENLDIVDHLELTRIPVAFPVAFPAAGLQGARPFVGIAPRSRWPSKNWPAERFGELVRRLLERGPGTVFLLGGPGDVETCLAVAAVAGDTERVVNLAANTSLIEMGGVLGELDLLVANDTGPVHMSVALGTPTLVVFGPTFADRTGPYGEAHTVVQADRPAPGQRPSRTDTSWIRGVTVDMVWDGVVRSGVL